MNVPAAIIVYGVIAFFTGDCCCFSVLGGIAAGVVVEFLS